MMRRRLMGPMGLLSAVMSSDGGIPWLQRDDYKDTRAAGSVDGTPATPGPGTRKTSMVDDSEVSVSNGELLYLSPSGFSDKVYLEDGVIRISGRVLVHKMGSIEPSGRSYYLGYHGALAGASPSGPAFHYGTLGYITVRHNNVSYADVYDISTGFMLAIVLRDPGAYWFVKDDGTWHLIWFDSIDTITPLYAFSGGTNISLSYEFMRLPEQIWLPKPLMYDMFTDTNGVGLDAHASNIVGPDSQAIVSRRWTERSGNWDIQSNKANPDGAAIATVDVGQSDIIADLTVAGGAAGQPGIVLRFADTNNYWYLQADRANNQLELHEVNAGVDNVRANRAVTINDSTDYVLRARCYGQTIDGYVDGENKIRYESASLNETKTEHGLYSDNTACEFDDFLVFPYTEGAGGGYSTLDKFIRTH